jgi:hypothetical protein
MRQMLYMGPRKIPKEWLRDLKAIKTIAPPPPPKDTLYPWLEQAYRLRRKMRRVDGPVRARAMKYLHDKHEMRIKKDCTRLIIELTAGKHVKSKTKTKYANALNWALSKSIKAQELTAFIKREGNINGCAEKYLRFQKRQQR